MKIDLNADVGEIEGEAPLYEIVSSVNIACGGHAGDERAMREAIGLAAARGVAAGAHPGYPDRENFGRRALQMSLDEVKNEMFAQIRTLSKIAAAHGVALTHVKPHGALYNQAADDESLARAIIEASADAAPGARVVALAGSVFARIGGELGVAVGSEGFADRAYRPDGSLAPRGVTGALIEDPETAAAQAVQIALGEPVRALDGTLVAIHADTICIHGDTPGALAIAGAVRAALERSGFGIAAY